MNKLGGSTRCFISSFKATDSVVLKEIIKGFIICGHGGHSSLGLNKLITILNKYKNIHIRGSRKKSFNLFESVSHSSFASIVVLCPIVFGFN